MPGEASSRSIRHRQQRPVLGRDMKKTRKKKWLYLEKLKMDFRERFLGEDIWEEMKLQVVGIKPHYSSNKANILFINKTKPILPDLSKR